MTKTLAGYIGDETGAPLPEVAAVVTRVSDGAVITSGVSDADGTWSFSGLPTADEYLVTLTDDDGRAAVRGPWSGEMRALWVANKPVAVDPAAGNALTWGADGLHAAVTDAYTEAESDARYLQLTGGTLTGTLTSRAVTPSANYTYDLGATAQRWNRIYGYQAYLDGTANINPSSSATDVLRVWAGSDPQYRFTLRADGQIQWGPGSAVPNVTLAWQSTGNLRLTGTLSFPNSTNHQHLTSAADTAWVYYNTAAGYQRIIWQRKLTNAIAIHDADANRDLFTVAQNSGNAAIYGALTIGGNVGFYGTAAGAKPTVSGAKGSNAALGSLLTALAGLGLITDSSTA